MTKLAVTQGSWDPENEVSDPISMSRFTIESASTARRRETLLAPAGRTVFGTISAEAQYVFEDLQSGFQHTYQQCNTCPPERQSRP
jgi:hypothetical protein